jgi:hypothetical protein
MQHMKNELRTTSYIPNLEAVIRNAGGVALKVEEPADRVEQPQPGGDGRVLQSGQKKHDEEHGHHLQRVLVAPLHSQEQKIGGISEPLPSPRNQPHTNPISERMARMLGAPARS